jgi:hypothetical protein
VVKVPKAVCLPLQDLDFGVEAHGDPVVPGKSPHGGNFGCPTVEGLAELHQLRQDGLAQLVDRFEKTRGQRTALFTGAMLFQEQMTEPLFETVDLAHGREAVEVGLQLFGLAWLEVVAVPPTGQEVQVDEPDDMKPVGDNRRFGKMLPHQGSVRAGQIHADPPHPLFALQAVQIAVQSGFAPPQNHIENGVSAQIAQRGDIVIPPAEEVLVDAQHPNGPLPFRLSTHQESINQRSTVALPISSRCPRRRRLMPSKCNPGKTLPEDAPAS